MKRRFPKYREETPEVRRRSFLLAYTNPDLMDKPVIPKVYNQEQLEMREFLRDLSYIADRDLYLPSFEWQQYNEVEKQFDVEHRLKHTYLQIIKPENGYDQEEQVRAINCGQFYEGPQQIDSRQEKELERQGGLRVTNVQFKSKVIKGAWCKASKQALERKKFEELQQKKQEEIEARKQVIKNQMRKKFAAMFLKKQPGEEQ